MNSDTRVYTRIKNVYIKDEIHQFQLSKGFLHRNTITISKDNSSREFVSAFLDFIKNGSITLKEGSDVDQDFEKLAQFDLVHLKLDNKLNNLIIIEPSAFNFIKKYLETDNELKKTNDFLSDSEIDILLNQRDTLSMNKIATNFYDEFNQYNLYVILPYSEIRLIRAINTLTYLTKLPYTLIFFDNDNIFATNIKHGETGCYECLEKSFVSKFPNNMFYYENSYPESSFSHFDISMYGIIISILNNEIKNTKLFGDTTLMGNIMHFYLPTYEYDFNFNKRQSCCTTCATINHILFEEQNMRSVEIMKEILKNDNISK